MTWLHRIVATATLTLVAAVTSRADTTHDLARFLSGSGNVAYLTAAVFRPVVLDGRPGGQRTLRTADAMGTALAVSELTKLVVHERRPTGSNLQSFPSGHATVAFAAAAMEGAFHPREAPLWYGGAALIGWSRVDLREHHTHDVVAGALIGYGVARLELSTRHGILLFPWIGSRTSAVGLSLVGRL